MQDVARWRQARTVAQYGECVALWLEGRLSHRPTSHYCEGVAAETTRILPTLTALNRSGFFATEQSQPGCTPKLRAFGGTRPWQRAAVMGFVPTVHIDRVKRALSSVRGLEVKYSPPGSPSSPPTQVTCLTKAQAQVRLFGGVLDIAEIAEQFGPVPGWDDHPGLQAWTITALQQAWQVSVVDMLWGRNDTLWPALRRLARS